MNFLDQPKHEYTYTDLYRYKQLTGICNYGPEFKKVYPLGSEYNPKALKDYINWKSEPPPFEYYPNAFDLFRSQTKEQFARSVEFLEVLTRHYLENGISLFDMEIVHESLINLALIYGIYRNRCRYSIEEVVNRSSIDELQDERYLFCALFLRYDEPRIFTRRVYTLDAEALEVLMDFFEGKSVRNNLPYPVSREEFHTLFYAFPEELNPCVEFIATFSPRKFLRKMILLVKLTNGVENSADVFSQIVFFSEYMRKDPDIFMLDLNFWRRFVEICATNSNSRNVHWYHYLVQEFEDDRYSNGYLYPLKVKSFESLVQKAIDVTLSNDKDFTHVYMDEFIWDKGLKESLFIDLGNESYRIDELGSHKELIKEANQLQHCVAERTLYYASRMKRVFGLRVRKGVEYIPCITIEVRRGTIVQTRGFQNRSTSELEDKVIGLFAKKLRFKLAPRHDRCPEPLLNPIDF
ncbi:MAG: PcfJ domain-containing protein [Flavobacteriales bacterium]|nr:PcfJ domain-containing protein [Flavobacteriales bacterium]